MTARATRVLVTAAGTGLGNNVMRSLRAADLRLIVVGCHHDRFELRKSPADRNYLVPRAGTPGFVASVRHVVAAERVDVVVPSTDADVRAVSHARRRLGCHVFLPRHRVIERCQDKYSVTRFLRARGVPVPLTYPVRDLRTVAQVFNRLPPARLAWCRARSGSGSFAATSVQTAAQARAWIAYWRDLREVPPSDFMLCEYLPGRDFGCQSLWHEGRLVLAKTFERLAYFVGGNQPSGVSSVASLAKAVVEPRVVEVCTAAVRTLDARTTGLYCIDLKENAASVPCITDINVGRFSLTTGLYDLVGRHNMAGAYVRLAVGAAVDFGDAYDRVEDHYLVRDIDTLPEIFHADDLFNGIEDARG